MISWRKHYKRVLLACSLLLTTSASIYAQDLKGDAKKGETLFKTNCSACHALDKQMVGPALGGVVDRLKTEQNLGVDWFQKWIRDNKALRASGDKYANEVFEKFNKVEMTAFPNLTDQDIADLLEYTTNPPKAEPAAAETDVNSPEAIKAAQDEKNNSSALLISLAAVGGLLLWLLFRLTQLVNLHRKSGEISALSGMIKSGTITNPTTIANLPTGFRPSTRIIGLGVNSNAEKSVRVDVNTNGDIILTDSGITNGWISLDNITFIAG
jgi:cytochrome c2